MIDNQAAPAAAPTSRRYMVIHGSQSGHCCFDWTVVDTAKPSTDPVGLVSGTFDAVCECFEGAEAEMIAAALNRASEAGGDHGISDKDVSAFASGLVRLHRDAETAGEAVLIPPITPSDVAPKGTFGTEGIQQHHSPGAEAGPGYRFGPDGSLWAERAGGKVEMVAPGRRDPPPVVASLSIDAPMDGDLYQHRKGGKYRVIHVGVEESTGRLVVIYRQARRGLPGSERAVEDTVWVRPLSEFCDGRFTRIMPAGDGE